MIPIGFRFEPSDEEVLRGFLLPWIVGSPLPWNAIVYKPLYGPTAAPWLVFADDADSHWQTKEEGGATKSTTYVFTNLTRVYNSKRISRTSGGGTWGGQTGPKKIFNSDTGEAIGHMRMLSFEHPDCGASSDLGHWIMHEYALSDKILKEIGKDGAGDMVVCKITRCLKNSGGKRRQPPQLQFFPPATAYIQENNGCQRAAEEYRVQEVQELARCIENSGGDHQQPQEPQFFPLAAAVANVQETGRKRAAEESRAQETVCKKCKSCGGGGVTEVIPEAEKVDDSWLVSALEQDDNIEMSSDGSGLPEAVAEISEAKKEADSWLVSAENVELPYFVDSEEAGFPEAVAQSDSWQATASKFDDNFDIEALLGYEVSNCNVGELLW